MTRKKIIKRSLLIIFLLLIVFVVYLLINTFSFKSQQLSYDKIDDVPVSNNSVNHFIEALKIKTVSPEDLKEFDSTQFQQFSNFLSDTYPLSDSLLSKKTFNEYSFLYTWKGSK